MVGEGVEVGSGRAQLLVKVGMLLCVILSAPLRAASEEAPFRLTDEERAWLAAHPVIRVAPDPNFGPIEWFNQRGDYQGVSSDYVGIVQRRLGVRFEVVRTESWNELLAKIQSREVDVLTAVVATGDREDYLAFTKPYFETTRAIFSAQSLQGVSTLEDLTGYKIAVVKGSWMDEQLSQRTGMSINRFQDLTTALIATSRGVTDVTCSAHETMAFHRRQEGLTNLRLVATLPDPIELRFGVRRDWAPLAELLDRALATVDEERAMAIRSTWIDVDEPRFWEKPVYRYSALATLALLVAMLVSVLSWNRSLNARVRRRTAQLEAAHVQLMQAEKLKSIGRLSAGIAHEVKNPLAIIQMGVDFLVSSGPPNEASGEVLSDMDDAVRRADGVVRGLLDFSREEELDLQPARLDEVVEESLRLVGHELRQRRIRVEVELPAPAPTVRMDRNKIQQVLINLFMNASQAMEGEGRLSVSCQIEDFIVLRVVDSGPGIAEEDVARLFDPFFTTKPVGEGTGLGLSVSRNIVELHGGSLDIANAPDGGAMVTLRFPKEPVEEQA